MATYTKHENGLYTWPTLYKKGSKGKEQQWDINVVPLRLTGGDPKCSDTDWADIRVEHGQVGGKIQTALQTVKKGKNLGKANATTPEVQAVSEAEAKWVKQQDKGYSTERGGGSMELKPMLAQKYGEAKDVAFPAHIQPKLDGCRCLAFKEADGKVRLISRQNKEFGAWLNHIRQALDYIMKVGEIFDGELYIHGVKFQTTLSYIKKEYPESKNLCYHVYDMVSDKPFKERFTYVANAIKRAAIEVTSVLTACIRIVDTYDCPSHDAVEEFHEEVLGKGYEGAILRVGDCKYSQGYRSRELLKVKAMDDGEFTIVDVEEGKGKFEGRAVFVVSTGDDKGTTFSASPKGRDELRQRYYEDREKLKGKQLTVQYFGWTTSDPPKPRHPVAVAVRDYE